MQCTEGTRPTVRTAALVAVVAALVTGGAHAAQASMSTGSAPATTAGPVDPALVVALPRVTASNRAW